MKGFDTTGDKDWPGLVKKIKESKMPEIEKLAHAFALITGRTLKHASDEIEVAQAMSDEEALIKHQVKMETIKHIRGIFQECHKLATGRKAWDE